MNTHRGRVSPETSLPLPPSPPAPTPEGAPLPPGAPGAALAAPALCSAPPPPVAAEALAGVPVQEGRADRAGSSLSSHSLLSFRVQRKACMPHLLKRKDQR